MKGAFTRRVCASRDPQTGRLFPSSSSLNLSTTTCSEESAFLYLAMAEGQNAPRKASRLLAAIDNSMLQFNNPASAPLLVGASSQSHLKRASPAPGGLQQNHSKRKAVGFGIHASIGELSAVLAVPSTSLVGCVYVRSKRTILQETRRRVVTATWNPINPLRGEIQRDP